VGTQQIGSCFSLNAMHFKLNFEPMIGGIFNDFFYYCIPSIDSKLLSNHFDIYSMAWESLKIEHIPRRRKCQPGSNYLAFDIKLRTKNAYHISQRCDDCIDDLSSIMPSTNCHDSDNNSKTYNNNSSNSSSHLYTYMPCGVNSIHFIWHMTYNNGCVSLTLFKALFFIAFPTFVTFHPSSKFLFAPFWALGGQWMARILNVNNQVLNN
jgi:hypothetical protein